MRAELLVDKGAARSQIKLANAVSRYELVAAGLASGEVSEAKAGVITKALDKIDADGNRPEFSPGTGVNTIHNGSAATSPCETPATKSEVEPTVREDGRHARPHRL
ncbi:hypothetical protein [Nocardioides sp. NPDC006273]|uniref:hypothetical protein n=1 Tax=Nocardioides sp. NPDC006273 TaxID=3155598 RepID=UPI0033B25ADB